MNVKALCKLTLRLCLCCSYDLGYSALHLWAESSLSAFLLPDRLVGAVAVSFLRRETVHLPNTPPPQRCNVVLVRGREARCVERGRAVDALHSILGAQAQCFLVER